MQGHARRQRWWRLVSLLLVVGLVAAACDDGDDDGDGGQADGGTTQPDGDEAPQRGGRVVYGLEAETEGGWCLPEAQLAISGIQVARAVYDTLAAPNADGEIEPYLAEAIEPNDDFTEWAITLREGVKFHDGTDLTAEVVKNNLDAYRGQYANRQPLLFLFVFANIASVDVVDPSTVRVTTSTPWPALPWYLYGSGRVGMMAQAQLDDAETCDRQLIGTGPFTMVDWRVNDRFVARAFPDYWQTAPDGEPFPYLEEIEFRPIPPEDQRLSALETGEVTAMHTSTPGPTVADLEALEEQGDVDLLQTDEFTEVNYGMFNQSAPPFDSMTARMAVAHATDRETLDEVLSKGVGTIAPGPFAPGNIGYLEDTGFPEFDLERARALVQQYEQETGNALEFSYTTTNTPVSTQTAQLLQEMAEAAGMTMTIRQVDQTTLIDEAIAGNFQLMGWRNHPGGDPDIQYIWWRSGSPVNFGRINDPEIDRLLDAGRVATDPDEREGIYEELNRRFASEVHNNWTSYARWAVGSATDVRGVLGPDLPSGTGPFPGIVTGHPVHGMWIAS